MFNLIPLSLLIGSLGGILYVISGHLSEFNDEEEKSDVFGFNLKARFIEYVNQLPLDNIKSQSLSLTRKVLHRFRLALLRTDNHLIKLISKISQQDKIANGNGKGNDNDSNSSSNFWEDLANKNKDEKQFTMRVAEPEVKIDFTIKNEAAKNFFDSVRNQTLIASADVKTHRISNGVDIKPAKVSLEIPGNKSAKKSLKKKKHSK